MENTTYLVHSEREEAIERLRAHLNVVAPGTPIFERKGDRRMPSAALALHVELDHSAFTTIDVDRQDALRFLRGEAIQTQASSEAPDPSPHLRLIRFERHALGFVSKAGDRWNNQWPKPWRIRMR